MDIPSATELFDLSHTLADELLLSVRYTYLAVPRIKDFITMLSKGLDRDEYEQIIEGVFSARDATVSESASIIAPCVIGHNAEVRPGAFIRGSALIGNGAVIGNSTEIKNAVIFDEVHLPHYNYVGDSVLGYRVHLGAGAVISNLRLDGRSVAVRNGGERLDTGLRKFGSLVGDRVEIGCNSVICPGSIIRRGATVYPLSLVRGIINENAVLYNGER